MKLKTAAPFVFALSMASIAKADAMSDYLAAQTVITGTLLPHIEFDTNTYDSNLNDVNAERATAAGYVNQMIQIQTLLNSMAWDGTQTQYGILQGYINSFNMNVTTGQARINLAANTLATANGLFLIGNASYQSALNEAGMSDWPDAADYMEEAEQEYSTCDVGILQAADKLIDPNNGGQDAYTSYTAAVSYAKLALNLFNNP